MALAERSALRVRLKRFPRDVREELNKTVHRSSWQALRKEFSVDRYTGLKSEALDFIPNLIDSKYKDLREDVKNRMEILKRMKKGDHQAFKGKSKVGFYSYFYRFWIVGERRADGLFDILFTHISREEEFDFFLFLSKITKGTASALYGTVSSLSKRTLQYVRKGVFGEDGTPSLPEPTDQTPGSPYTDLTQELGDRLTEYEMVEDLIEKGMLAEKEDGTLYIQLD